MVLRENQVEAVHKGVQFFKQSKSVPSIIIAPTAYGKSIVIAKIAYELNEKIIVIQPSKELLEQNYDKFVKLGGTASIFSASMGEKEIGDVTYVTIGSAINYAYKFKEFGITKVIIDECDRFPRNNKGQLRRFLKNIDATHILGLTATPLKLQSHTSMYGPYSKLVMLTTHSIKGKLFKEVIHIEQIQSMIERGYWSPLKYVAFSFDTRELVFNSTGADYTDESISKVYKAQAIEDKIIRSIEMIKDRKAIMVAVPTISDAIQVASRLDNAAVVHSKLPIAERKRVVDDFKSGKIRIVVQVSVLSVGFDYPELDCIISARPTASLSWWYQFVGRVTRIHPDKKDGLIIDLVGNVEKFGKVEDFVYVKEGNIWKLRGEGGRLLTGVPLHSISPTTDVYAEPEHGITELSPDELFEKYVRDKHNKSSHTKPENEMLITFGKFKGAAVHTLPKWYIQWLLTEFEWKEQHTELKNYIERVFRENPKVKSFE